MSLRLTRWVALGLVSIPLAFMAQGVGHAGPVLDNRGGGQSDVFASADGRLQGGELTIQGYQFASLDPHFSSFPQDVSLERMLWRGLYTLDGSNTPQPAMSAGLPQISPDGRTYAITLKSGLQWSDGNDLTAEDFEMGIKRTCNPVVGSEYEYVLTNLVGCDAHYLNPAGFSQPLEDAIDVNATSATTLHMDHKIGLADILRYIPVFGVMCTP